MNPEQRVEVRLPGSLAGVAQLHSVIEQFCRRQGIHPDIEFKIDLALEEVFTNIVRHGYADDRRHEVVVRLASDRERVRISVEDDARHFNPLRAPAVDVTAALAERRIGGLGIPLVRKLLDQVRYQRRPVGNRLILVKRLDPQEKQT